MRNVKRVFNLKCIGAYHISVSIAIVTHFSSLFRSRYQTTNQKATKPRPLKNQLARSLARTATLRAGRTTIVVAVSIATTMPIPTFHLLTTCFPILTHACFPSRAQCTHPTPDHHPLTWACPRGPQVPIKALRFIPHLLPHHHHLISKPVTLISFTVQHLTNVLERDYILCILMWLYTGV